MSYYYIFIYTLHFQPACANLSCSLILYHATCFKLTYFTVFHILSLIFYYASCLDLLHFTMFHTSYFTMLHALYLIFYHSPCLHLSYMLQVFKKLPILPYFMFRLYNVHASYLNFNILPTCMFKPLIIDQTIFFQNFSCIIKLQYNILQFSLSSSFFEKCML